LSRGEDKLVSARGGPSGGGGELGGALCRVAESPLGAEQLGEGGQRGRRGARRQGMQDGGNSAVGRHSGWRVSSVGEARQVQQGGGCGEVQLASASEITCCCCCCCRSIRSVGALVGERRLLNLLAAHWHTQTGRQTHRETHRETDTVAGKWSWHWLVGAATEQARC